MNRSVKNAQQLIASSESARAFVAVVKSRRSDAKKVRPATVSTASDTVINNGIFCGFCSSHRPAIWQCGRPAVTAVNIGSCAGHNVSCWTVCERSEIMILSDKNCLYTHHLMSSHHIL